MSVVGDPEKVEVFLNAMREKISAASRQDQQNLIEVNLKAFRKRFAALESWAQDCADTPPPFPDLDAWGCAIIINALTEMATLERSGA